MQLVQRPPDRGKEFLVGKGFGKIFLRPGLDRLHRPFDRGVTGNCHYFGILVVLPDMPYQIDATNPGHFQVRYDQVNRRILKNPDGLTHAGGSENPVSLGRQVSLEHFQCLFRVINNEDTLFLDGRCHLSHSPPRLVPLSRAT